MPRKNPRRGRRRRPPRWFMPTVMAGLGVAAFALSATMISLVE
ncbi:hypothetical protein Q4610_06660 [Sphingobium sp. HBC34]|uniref:Uncharacterized protein n=1 Tax=Sphingobium cyanobacteriorum TaxID=3063954 RepID=A0ABT8ZJM2_9SPHN|nr:hypothetical protein [Sphingobium sp. HBC34]MDO7834724.1 hypothetical protein [Sphingobium sp. HBC34]